MLESAQKYVQKGNFDRALKEYHKHLQAEPDDTNARLKLGDLHLKRADPSAAIEAYTHVASTFSRGGFDAKAVAIYKQILRIDPEYLDAHISLGDHFQRMGLTSEALRQFQQAVQICQEKGLKREAFDLLKRVAQLDPANVPNRLSLADLFVRESLRTEAREEYESLLKELGDGSDNEMLARVCEHMMAAFPDDERPVQLYARAQVDLGQHDLAVEKLKAALQSFPDSADLRQCLVDVHQAAGNAEAVGSVYREMAEVYKRHGDHDKARDILQRFVPVEAFGDDSDPDTSPSLILSDEADELDLEFQLEDEADELAGVAPTPAVPSARAGGPPTEDVSAEDLVAEARVSLEFGDADGAFTCVERALELDSQVAGGVELLEKIADAQEGSVAAPPALEAEAETADDEAQELEIDLADLGDADGFDTLPNIELVIEEEVEDDEAGEIEVGSDVCDEAARLAADQLDDLELEASGDDLDLDLHEGEADSELEREAAAEGDGGTSAEGFRAQSSAVCEHLEEAEFYFGQGMLDEAEKLYRKVLEIAAHHPQANLRIGEIEARQAEEGGAEAEAPDSMGETAIQEDLELEPAQDDDSVEPVVVEPDAEEAAAAVIAEEAADDEILSVQAEDTIPPVAAEETQDISDEADDGFDLAAELDDDGQPTLGRGGDFQEVFRAFKKGIQEQVGEDESEAHYDLAIAYKEMGLLDDAIEQLDLVRRAGGKQLEVLSLMATCKLERGHPVEAARHLEEALALAGDGHESVVALRYDLGDALLSAGKNTEALEAFERAHADDPAFREVRDRIEKLKK